jgi:hypothetical protein
VCAHLVTPGLGVEGTSYLRQGHWLFSSSFRYYNSTEDVLGSQPLSTPLVYANTHIYELDFSTIYALTDRIDLTLEGPLQYGTRRTSIEHDIFSQVRHTMRAFGPGNVTLGGECYLFEPRKTPDRNISLGLGVQFPIGDSNAKDYSYRATGKVLRPVDPAIQPAQDGWGILATIHGYSALYFPQQFPQTRWLRNTSVYLDGSYLATPQQFSNTETVFGDQRIITGGAFDLQHDSVVDQFLARTGVAQNLWPAAGLSASAGLRFEGVPKWDIIGGSDGFRLPGNSLSFEPSLALTRGKQSLSVSVPIAIHRYGSNSLANERAGGKGTAFDTIAGWQLVVSYTREF